MTRFTNQHPFTGSALVVLTAALVLVACPAGGQTVLFDGSLGTTPSAQGWPFFTDPITGHSVTQTPHDGFTTLDSQSPMSDRGGYFSNVLGIFQHPDMPVINRASGYTIRFDVRVVDEVHVTGATGDDNGDGLEDRAGFAVIVISEDLEGLELSFWNDRIWTQEDDAAVAANLFTQAEGVSFDTTANLLRYDVRVFGDRYQLVAGGGVAPLLQGPLRNYTSFMGSLDPYETPSFLFFGDNTMRGEAEVQLGLIAVEQLPDPCSEADALVAEIVAGTHNPFFDLNGDGLVDAADMTDWLSVAGGFYLGTDRSYLAGDANLDGVVDTSDFNLWNGSKFTPSSAWCSGDFNTDGFVDASDFNVWNSNKFTVADDAPATVPEPVGLAGAWMAVLSVVALRRGL